MKISKVLSFLMLVALVSPQLGHSHQGNEEPSQAERNNMMVNLGLMGAVSYGIHKGGEMTGASKATMGILHTANVLVQLGQVSNNPVLNDLGWRALLAGAVSKVATSDIVTKMVPYIPFVGKSIEEAGGMGKAVLLVASYELAESGYEAAWEHLEKSDLMKRFKRKGDNE